MKINHRNALPKVPEKAAWRLGGDGKVCVKSAEGNSAQGGAVK